VDINSPYPSTLHVNQVPWNVEFGETANYLCTGDAIIAKTIMVDETRKIEISMDEKGSRKIEDGTIIEVQPSKVPRVIGKSGSMISLLKKYSNCWIFVGQNGRIWIKGDQEKVALVTKAVRTIEKEAHTMGLTNRTEELLKEGVK
jgi:exosome complex component RRP4